MTLKIGDVVRRKPHAISDWWARCCKGRGLNSFSPLTVRGFRLGGESVVFEPDINGYWYVGSFELITPTKLEEYL